MKLQFNSATHVGQRRTQNEDFFFVDKDTQLYIVCDGMGGHAAGEVASQLAVKTFVNSIRKSHSSVTDPTLDSYARSQKALKAMENAGVQANDAVHQAAKADEERAGMGTTLTALYIIGKRGYVAQVGDSRLYVYRGNQVHQITEDHTVVNKMIRAGRLRPEDANKVKYASALTRAVGVYPHVEVETLSIDVLPQDLFLICSDGLYRYFEYLDVNVFFEHLDLENGAKALVAYANSKGGRDNITVILVKALSGGETPETLRVRLTISSLRKVSFFKYLTYSELLRVITICETVEVANNTRVIEYGKPGREFFLLLQGSARVHRGEKTLVELEPGAHFGEMSLIDNQPRSASITTTSQSVLIRIGRDDFYNVLREDSVLGVKLLWNFVQALTKMVRQGNSDMTETAIHHPYGSKQK